MQFWGWVLLAYVLDLFTILVYSICDKEN
jgi:hypothetical protein